jgi:hypothetical protein
VTVRLLAGLALLTAVITGAAAGAAADPGTGSSYVARTVAGWAEGPVWVSPDSGALSAEQADRLATRIEAWRDDVHVAVLPAIALTRSAGGPGGDDFDRALAFVSRLHARLGEDGIYLVSFSGAGTYGGGWGTDAPVGEAVAHQVDAHTLDQVDAILTGVVDELQAAEAGPGEATADPATDAVDAPNAPDEGGGFPWGWLVAGLLLVIAVLVTVLVRSQRRTRVRPSGETWAGPADYRPSFAVPPDEHDSLAERLALGREDVTRLGEELDAADVPVTDPAVAEHVQASLDAYADASRRVDELRTEDELRTLTAVTEYARWQLACAEAVRFRAPLPPRRVRCFVDPAHGVSVADVAWAPPGGLVRPVPVCADCYARMTAR